MTSSALKSSQSAERELQQQVRGWCNLLAIWRLCDNSACPRAHACRGDISVCGKAKYPSLPEGVQTWFAGMMWAKEQDFTFDEALAMLEPSGANQAWQAWIADGTRLELNEPPG
jgi:hypothetical protein